MRVKLFDSIVSPCLLYACSTWALTREQEQRLTTVQRRMLRAMFARHFRRVSLESWPNYISEVTHNAEEIYQQHGGEAWVLMHRKRKWRFAARLASIQDGRWSCRLLSWRPVHARGRSVGRPCRRWSDDFCDLVGGDWLIIASDLVLWSALEDGFVHKCS